MEYHLTDGGCTGCFFLVIMSRVCIEVSGQGFCRYGFSLEGESVATGRMAPRNDIVKCFLAMASYTFLLESMKAMAAFPPPDTSCQLLAIPVGVCPNVKARNRLRVVK